MKLMKKIVNLRIENRFIYYFPIDFALQNLNNLNPIYIGENSTDFIKYLFNNVFINPNDLALCVEQKTEKKGKLKSTINFSELYKKFSFQDVNGNLIRDNLPEINNTWLKNNINAKNALNLSSIKKWEGQKFPISSMVNEDIIFKEFDFFEGFLAPDSGSTYFLTNPDYGGFYTPFSSYVMKNKNNKNLKKQLILYFKLIEYISFPISFESNILSKLSPSFYGNSFEDFKKYLKFNIDDLNNWEYLPELVCNEKFSDWLRSNSNILGSDFIESIEEWSGISTRRELDIEDVFDSHCFDYETLSIDFIEDEKSEDYGNWNFNQLEMF